MCFIRLLNCHLIQYFTFCYSISPHIVASFLFSISSLLSFARSRRLFCHIIIVYLYFTLSLLSLLPLPFSFPYIQWSRKHTIKKKKKKKTRRKESSITYSTRPLEHQLRFWHATLINLRIIETQRHLLMYFRCAMFALCERALFVAKRSLMKVNVHLYCWFMCARTLLLAHSVCLFMFFNIISYNSSRIRVAQLVYLCICLVCASSLRYASLALSPNMWRVFACGCQFYLKPKPISHFDYTGMAFALNPGVTISVTLYTI